MVRRNAAREQAIAAAKAQRRAEGQKLSRLRRAGVDVSSLDQRASNSQLEGMTVRQIRTQTERGRRFTSRSTSFVAGLNGTPLSGNTWRQYQQAERAYNAKSEKFYESVKDLTIPTLNQTVGQYIDGLRDSRRAGDYRTFGRLERTAGNITNEKSLQRLLGQMEKRADPNYLQKEAQLQRRIIRKMLERTSNKDLIPTIRDMSDQDIITLSQYTEFIPTLEGSYAMAKSISTDTPRWQSSVYEDNEDTIQALIDWAGSRHETSEQDTDDTRTPGPQRDEYGRFVRRNESNPKPQFHRDEHGRFAPRTP